MTPEILDRLRAELRAAGLDAYLAYTPSNLLYTSGFESYFAMNWWRMHGTVLVVVPADSSLPLGMMVSDFEGPAARSESAITDIRTYRLWVESRAMSDLIQADRVISRPAQFDTDEQDQILVDLLGDRGLLDGRIGTDLQFISHSLMGRLERTLPDARWADATDLLYGVRRIKTAEEVDRLCRATELSEAGMRHAAGWLEVGMSAAQVRSLYVLGVVGATLAKPERYPDYSDNWVLPAVGRATSPGQASEGLQPGGLVKFDCGTTVGGYRSDGGRTFAFGHVTPEAGRIYAVLLEAHQAARDLLAPGVEISQVFHAAVDVVRAGGYPGYSRGHIGHSVGIDTFHEEPPYLSPYEHGVLEEGMVLAVETPFYGEDVGAVMIEDLVHITANGHKVMHTMSYELEVV